MNIDRQRRDAVALLERQGWAWDGASWKAPAAAASAPPPAPSADFCEGLCERLYALNDYVMHHCNVRFGDIRLEQNVRHYDFERELRASPSFARGSFGAAWHTPSTTGQIAELCGIRIFRS